MIEYLLISIFMFFNNSNSYQEITINYNEKEFLNVARDSLKVNDDFSNEIEYLDLRAIPILDWKTSDYKCSDNISLKLSDELNPNFQRILIYNKISNNTACYELFDLMYSNRIFHPVIKQKNEHLKQIFKYMDNNKDSQIFMIRGLRGYWAVNTSGQFVKLRWKKVRFCEIDANEEIQSSYGEDFINDLINNNYRIGFAYQPCIPESPFNSIKIKIKKHEN